MKFLPYGERSVLIELGFSAASEIKTIRDCFPEAEVLLGLESVVLRFPEAKDYLEHVAENFPKLSKTTAATGEYRSIPIHYNGEDLSNIASLLKLSTEELIEIHQQTIWQVALIGFAPGFPYLVPATHQDLYSQIPRLDSPRTKVPANSVALAGGMCCIYPNSSPGGWQLIGSTSVSLFDTERENPSLLAVGDLIRFEQVQ